MTYTLTMFNTGQVTLPKKWRNKFETKKFIAKETPEWLLIKPLVEDNSVFYENEEWFGVYSPAGMDPEQIISEIKKLQNG